MAILKQLPVIDGCIHVYSTLYTSWSLLFSFVGGKSRYKYILRTTDSYYTHIDTYIHTYTHPSTQQENNTRYPSIIPRAYLSAHIPRHLNQKKRQKRKKEKNRRTGVAKRYILLETFTLYTGSGVSDSIGWSDGWLVDFRCFFGRGGGFICIIDGFFSSFFLSFFLCIYDRYVDSD